MCALLAGLAAGQEASSCFSSARGVVTSTLLEKVKDAGINWGLAFLEEQSFNDAPLIDVPLTMKVQNLRNIVVSDGYTADLSLAQSSSGGMGGEVDAHVKADVTGEVDLTLLLFCHSTVSFKVSGIDVTARGSFDLTAASGLSIDILQLDANLHDIGNLKGGCAIPTILNILQDLGLDFLSGILRGLIRDGLEKGKAKLEDLANSALQSFPWQTPLPLPAPWNGTILDFHLCEARVRGSGSEAMLEVGVKGEVRDADFPSVVPPIPRTFLPETNVSAHDANLILGNYTADTLLYTYFQQGILSLPVHRADLPAGPLQDLLNTDFFEVLLPTLWARHKHANMTLAMSVSSRPSATISPHKLQAQAGLDFGFFVEQPGADPLPAFTLTCNAIVAGSASVNGTQLNPVKVTGEIDSMTGCAMEMKDVSCFGCKPGVELISSVERKANDLFQQVLIPGWNSRLRNGVEIPLIELRDSGKVIDISFSNGLIDEEDNFGEVAVDVAFSVRDQFSDNRVVADDLSSVLVV